jgi:hypothetical protein
MRIVNNNTRAIYGPLLVPVNSPHGAKEKQVTKKKMVVSGLQEVREGVVALTKRLKALERVVQGINPVGRPRKPRPVGRPRKPRPVGRPKGC